MTLAWLSPEFAQRLSASLLHFVWQGSVIGLVTAAALRMLRRQSSEVRYATGIAGMIAMLFAPIVTFVFQTQVGAISKELLHLATITTFNSDGVVAPASVVTMWSKVILFVWCIGVAAFLLRLVVGWHLSRQLVRLAISVVPADVQQVFNELRQQLGLNSCIRLLVHSRIDSPVVIGWLRPVVLLPASALTGLGEKHLVALFAHELAHIRRHDFLVNMLQRCVEAMLFYHPAVWWMSRRIRAERENCCDDLAVRVCGNRRTYVEALVLLERERQTVPVLAVAAADSNIVQRVRRILGLENYAVDWESAAIALTFVIVWMIVGLWQSTTLQASALPSRLPVVLESLTRSPETEIRQAPGVFNTIAAIVTAPAQVASAQQNANVSGKVVRAGTTDPIPNAGIELSRVGGGSPKAYTASTASDGTFSFQDVPAGQYQLAAARTGFIRSEFGQRGPNGRGTTITVGAGQNIKDANIGLTQTGTIAGAIVDRKGAPMPSVQVLALRSGFQGPTRALLAVKSSITNDLGQYRLYGLPPGQYVLSVTPLRTSATDMVTDMMSDGYTISRSLPAPAGAPILLPNDDQTIPLYYPETTSPQFASPVSVRSGESIGGINIRYVMPATWRVRGTVSNRPVAPAGGRGGAAALGVTLAPRGARSDALYVDGAPMSPRVNVDANGAFEFRGVLPGSYDVFADSGNRAGPAGGLSGLLSIEVAGADVDNVNIPLAGGFELPVHVAITGLPANSDDLSLSAVRFGLVSTGTQRQFSVQPVSPQNPASLVARGVTPGEYRLMYSVMGDIGEDMLDLLSTTIRWGGVDVSDGFRIDRTPDNPIEVVFQVNQNTGGVSGTVVNSRMEPVSNVMVALIPDRKGAFKSEWTDDAGKFRFDRIPAGDYKLYAWEDVDRYAWQSQEYMKPYLGRGTGVHIENGSNATTQVTVIPYAPTN